MSKVTQPSSSSPTDNQLIILEVELIRRSFLGSKRELDKSQLNSRTKPLLTSSEMITQSSSSISETLNLMPTGTSLSQPPWVWIRSHSDTSSTLMLPPMKRLDKTLSSSRNSMREEMTSLVLGTLNHWRPGLMRNHSPPSWNSMTEPSRRSSNKETQPSSCSPTRTKTP